MPPTLQNKINQYNYKSELTRTITKKGAITATSTYTYNHKGDRISHTANGVTTYDPNQYSSKTGTILKKYLYNGSDIIATINTTPATTTKYISHFDHQGSTNITTDHNTGNPVQVLDYYPFGSIRVDTSTTSYDPIHKYIGQEYDEESGQSYLNARYLNNERGQFASEDPVFWEVGQSSDGATILTNPQMQNSYSYAGNNPVTLKDPEGRCPVCAGAFALFMPSIAYSPAVGEESYT
jgi:RHS repeat-associated protein